MKKLLFIIFCTVILSCSNDDDTTGEFGKCDFSESFETSTLKNKKGILHYSKSIQGNPVNDYTYYIKTKGELPLVICNMPDAPNVEKNGKVSVTFSGIMEVYSDKVDAISTRLELTDIDYHYSINASNFSD